MNTKKITIISLLAAMTALLTFFPHIPIPGTQGYIHLGDSIIYLTAFALGGSAAAFAGAIGGAIADLLVAPVYAIPTCIIKGLAGFISGYIFTRCKNKSKGKILAFISGGIIITIGYYIAELIMTSSTVVPLAGMPYNIIQTIGSIPIPCLVLPQVVKLIGKTQN